MASPSLSAASSYSARRRSLPAFSRRQDWRVDDPARAQTGLHRTHPATNVCRRVLQLFRSESRHHDRHFPDRQIVLDHSGGSADSRHRLCPLPSRAPVLRSVVGSGKKLPAREELRVLGLQFLHAMTARTHSRLTSKRRSKLLRREQNGGDMLPYARHLDEFTLVTRDG